ncbi:MAG: hypothetical protein IKE30_04350 [Clostridia bacterium]|nr:hypothetical protein [Clostridia bacterium]
MKRIVSVLLILLFTALPLHAEQAAFSAFDFVCGHAGSDWICYIFPDITLYMPLAWEGRITAVQDSSGVSFYQTASLEKYAEEGVEGGGFLFRLCASEDESFRDLPAYADLGYSENVGLHFYLTLPSDYPAYPGDEAVRAEYDEMAKETDTIREDAEIGPNMSFYPPDGVPLDGNGLA